MPRLSSSGSATRRLRSVGLAGIIGVIAVAGVAGPVSAREVERESRGTCTGNTRWELSLEKEHGRIEVDLELDTTRRGRAWNVRLYQNGSRFLNVVRTTDREREIDVSRVRPDRSGRDTIRFRAVDRVNGEVCNGSLRI